MKLVVVAQEVRTSRFKSSLTKVEPTGQERTRVPPRKGPYGAGWSEDAGRVMEPRNGYSCGHKDISHSGTERKADGVHAPEGSSPGRVMASVEDTTGV